jgi:hypothetical protein
VKSLRGLDEIGFTQQVRPREPSDMTEKTPPEDNAPKPSEPQRETEDVTFKRQMELARRVMKKRWGALRVLSKM